ncbi:hypothetical protein GGTG_06569 [Gaeumannomyces tritici R3-111a-1]|uniref:Uncharacterized protein n=1 Tax=Gaeumannomyces tritici (strain R3-111a-1) TaxID=644352 RepID=J3NZ69_GAET3|nr:hypothetical protein GGTG_06569 [Gaeumannomyces tritici R3-111a-1]EJT76652.1 hypothetical protein GGTG_06569 [Gaeumannomyces tritici R3-111a-1]
MAEEGGGAAGPSAGPAGPPTVNTTGMSHAQPEARHRPTESGAPLEQIESPMSPGVATPNPFSRQQTSLDLDDYFSGPRDLQKHSKWPIFLQMHGSILPKLILPLVFVGAWATVITYITLEPSIPANLGINPVLLTVLGFVVGLGLSFRSSTAYERYGEGRRYWATLILACQNLGRVYWIHAKEREGELREKDVLAKLSALNLLTAFAVALKHKLRFEPYTNYEDLQNLVGHLDTLAGEATKEDPTMAEARRIHVVKAAGEMLGVSFAASNPRKALKKARRPLGNLPLEILSYLAAYTDEIIANGQLPVPMQQTLAYNNMALLNDVLTGTERVLTTPLPIAYAIAIAQITWLYIILLPFQLVKQLEWVAIPGTMAASYIILGLLFIGREVENPFGQDVNDLPLESYCAQIAAELDVLASRPKATMTTWIENLENKPLFPYSAANYNVWRYRGEEKVRQALRGKTELGFENRKRMMGQEDGPNEGGHSHPRKSKVEGVRPGDVESQDGRTQ